jgi:hypothetical protein
MYIMLTYRWLCLIAKPENCHGQPGMLNRELQLKPLLRSDGNNCSFLQRVSYDMVFTGYTSHVLPVSHVQASGFNEYVDIPEGVRGAGNSGCNPDKYWQGRT